MLFLFILFPLFMSLCVESCNKNGINRCYELGIDECFQGYCIVGNCTCFVGWKGEYCKEENNTNNKKEYTITKLIFIKILLIIGLFTAFAYIFREATR